MHSQGPKGMITTEWDKPQHIVVIMSPTVHVLPKGWVQMMSIS